jgi:hypothetical protein
MKNQESLTSSGGAFSMIGIDKKHESIGRKVTNSFILGHKNTYSLLSAYYLHTRKFGAIISVYI